MTAVTLAPVKPILRVADVCELLGIKQTKFYELRASGWFGSDGPALIEVLPPVDRFPRFRGAPFRLLARHQTPGCARAARCAQGGEVTCGSRT